MVVENPMEAVDAFICENLRGDAALEKAEIAADLAKAYMAMSQCRFEQDQRRIGGGAYLEPAH